MKQVQILLCLFISVFSLNCKEESSDKKQFDIITSKEAYRLLQDKSVQLIDVRTPKEYAETHIKNAKNINFFDSSFSTRINKLDKQKPVMLYCKSGKRSKKSAIEFYKAGFKKVYSLEGGILNWKSNQLPLDISK